MPKFLVIAPFFHPGHEAAAAWTGVVEAPSRREAYAGVLSALENRGWLLKHVFDGAPIDPAVFQYPGFEEFLELVSLEELRAMSPIPLPDVPQSSDELDA